MKQHTITFRCSQVQMNRLDDALISLSHNTRTELLATALEEFLDFAEQGDISGLNLFELVQRIDSEGSAQQFSSQV
ncbi:MAG: hypothetical protein IKL98_03060 [Akkermansia sp.]|nr:hypothetical protein [Akkermansiaceae bacterium]MBR3695202.1 hypothetical protein [Akkermansia sp.]